MFSTNVTIFHHLISQAGWNRCNLSIYLSTVFGFLTLQASPFIFWDLPGDVLAAPESALGLERCKRKRERERESVILLSLSLSLSLYLYSELCVLYTVLCAFYFVAAHVYCKLRNTPFGRINKRYIPGIRRVETTANGMVICKEGLLSGVENEKPWEGGGARVYLGLLLLRHFGACFGVDRVMDKRR